MIIPDAKVTPRVYLAAPFFSPEQISLITSIENLCLELGIPAFSPRFGDAALKMNEMLAKKEVPSLELKNEVFKDNWSNINNAPFMIAVIDGRDTGVVWEMGYAFKANVPIITFTDKNFGMNLMLAQCTIGHCKGIGNLKQALPIAHRLFDCKSSERQKIIDIVKLNFLTPDQLHEGPSEHKK